MTMTEPIDMATVRAAVMDVIDGGWQCSNSCDLKHPWSFPTEMFVDDRQPADDDIERRVKFVDAVMERITTLQRLGLK